MPTTRSRRANLPRPPSTSTSTAVATPLPLKDDKMDIVSSDGLDEGEISVYEPNDDSDAQSPLYIDGSDDTSSDDFVPQQTQRRKRASLPAAHTASMSSENGETMAELNGRRRPKIVPLLSDKPVGQKMPVFSDMKLLISPPLEDTVQPIALSSSGKRKSQGKDTKQKSKRKKKKKTLRERLEGDLSSADEDSDLVDPRKLPEEDVDHSKYSRLFACHPHLRHAWSSLGPPPPPHQEKIDQPAALRIKLLPFQQEGVGWMVRQEYTMFRGGILADEMGMGKTLQTIALMLENRGKPTLVICPTVALMQWKSEIEMATSALSVFIYYGNDRKKIVTEDGEVNMDELAKYDVILTTYAVLERGFRREHQGFRQKGVLLKEPSILHKINWFRLVLDEAHNIKDRSSNSARAAFQLRTQYTWSLTGTPLHNRVGELYSLIRLTKTDPFSMYFCHVCDCKSLKWEFGQSQRTCNACGHNYTTHFCYWNNHILNPIQNNLVTSPNSRMGFKKLGKLLDNIMLRRTKVERSQDLGLPPRIVVTRRDKFSPEEEDLYMSLFTDYQREFDTYAQHGTVLNNYANLFELISRMRLAANHPDLLKLKVGQRAKIGADSSDTFVCGICNEEAEDPILSKCKHIFCRVDARMYVESVAKDDSDDESAVLRCPMCYATFDIDLTQAEMTHSLKPTTNKGPAGTSLMESMMSTPRTMDYQRSIVNRIDMSKWRSSTKIEALVEELSKHRMSNANVKSIVFSQFVSFLDLIQWRLNRAGFSVCRLDGRMSPTQRDAVIRTFMTHPEYTVFLVSLKAGGVALNLTEASHVYLADCWWNPSVEVQAMDRIHRMGQYRPIKVTRIIIENSIESRIIALQVKKQHLVNSTIGRDRKSLDHLSAQDMQFLFSS